MIMPDEAVTELRRPRRRAGENRQLLIDAGIIEFAAHGYFGASTTAIATRAGVPQPHVYASFSSKSELFLACARRATSEALSGGSGDAEHDVLASMVLQICAALGERTLVAGLQPLLTQLRAHMDDRDLGELLSRGAAVLSAQAAAEASSEPAVHVGEAGA